MVDREECDESATIFPEHKITGI